MDQRAEAREMARDSCLHVYVTFTQGECFKRVGLQYAFS